MICSHLTGAGYAKISNYQPHFKTSKTDPVINGEEETMPFPNTSLKDVGVGGPVPITCERLTPLFSTGLYNIATFINNIRISILKWIFVTFKSIPPHGNVIHILERKFDNGLNAMFGGWLVLGDVSFATLSMGHLEVPYYFSILLIR